MYFKQFYLGCLAHASYMIADEESKDAVVVDPQRDIEQYLAEAKAHGFNIKYVLLTHFHADFLAGHLELRTKLGSTIMLGKSASAEYDFSRLAEGDKIELGKVRLEILETPGHTPEGICIVVYDLAKSADKPWGVLTGDTLFVGDVGRPDLLASAGVTPQQLASMLYDSLHNKLMKLPDETLVYPAHGAGSMCGKNLGKESYTTIGEQKKFNYALKFESKEDFIQGICSEQCDMPQYFAMNASLNKQERQMLHDHLPNALTKISIEDVLKMQKDGAQILDTRNPSEFAKGHLKGSFNIGLSGNYASWAGTVLDHTQPIVLIANAGKEEESALRLGRIGYDNVVGYLDGGPPSFLFRTELVTHLTRLSPQELQAEMASDTPPNVIDVRTESEYADKRIDGTVNIPLAQLSKRLQDVPTGKPLRVHCLAGYRSMIATSILLANGFDNICDLTGGINSWIDAGLPVKKEPAGIAN